MFLFLVAVKSLTISRKEIIIQNKYGYCCDCDVTEDLESEATNTIMQRSLIRPQGVKLSSTLSLVLDNFDR